ncbi:MAG: ABC transporter permease [Lachnospiraceae bacterium]|nr:ABC transporter permease [Lachnospiraceae bacterium]
MRDLIKTELFKLKKSRTFKILIIINLSVIITFILGVGIGYYDVEPHSLVGYKMYKSSVQYILHHGLVGYILASGFICSEYSQNTIGSGLVSGHSRTKLLLAKMIVFVCGVVILFLIYLAASTFITSFYTGGFVEKMTLQIWEYIVVLLSYSVIGYAVYGVLMACVAIVIKGKIKTIVIGMGMEYAMTQTDIITKDNPLPFIKYTFAYQLRHLRYKDWVGPGYWGGSFEPGVYIGVMVVTFIISMVVAVYAFNRAEMK